MAFTEKMAQLATLVLMVQLENKVLVVKKVPQVKMVYRVQLDKEEFKANKV